MSTSLINFFRQFVFSALNLSLLLKQYRQAQSRFKSKTCCLNISTNSEKSRSGSLYFDYDSLSIQDEHFSLPDSLINNSAIKARLCSHAAPKDASHTPLAHGGRYQLKQIWKKNKVQSTFSSRKWLWPVGQISQGLHGFCQLSIASCARERQEGERGGGREETVRSEPADDSCLSCPRIGGEQENHPQATANLIQNILPPGAPHLKHPSRGGQRGGEGGQIAQPGGAKKKKAIYLHTAAFHSAVITPHSAWLSALPLTPSCSPLNGNCPRGHALCS